MENQAQFGMSPSVGAQLEPETPPGAPEDTDGKNGSVSVQVDDASVPLLQEPNGDSAYGTLPPSTEDADPPGRDDRSWRQRPSVS